MELYNNCMEWSVKPNLADRSTANVKIHFEERRGGTGFARILGSHFVKVAGY
jgi:hypothetical protein